MLPGSDPSEKKAGLAYWANRVLDEYDKASTGFEPDPVHDLRVAIRRCRSMADGFLSVDPDPGWKQMKRLAKPLFSSLGDLRDAQVMLQWVAKFSEPGDAVGESLSAALTHQEGALKTAAHEALNSFDRPHWTALNAHLAKRTDRVPLEGLVFQHLALERWMEAYELHRRALRNRSGVAYHQLRIGIKRFRYTVENFLPQRHLMWSKDLRNLQNTLGDVHDFDVLCAMVRAHDGISAEDRSRWRKRIHEERLKRLHFYRQRMIGKDTLWRHWRSDLPSGAVLQESGLEKLRSWASFLDPDIAHSAHVTGIALQLYDGLSQSGILKVEAGYRRILQAAAILHEIGRSKTKAGGARGDKKRGYRMICKLKPPLGWTPQEMRCVAVVARYHQGKLPATSNAPFVGLDAKQRSALLPLIGVLRLANACDDAHDGSISGIELQQQEGSLILYGQGLEEMSPSAEHIAGARYLLEATCRVPIMIRPSPAKTSSAEAARTRQRVASTR